MNMCEDCSRELLLYLIVIRNKSNKDLINNMFEHFELKGLGVSKEELFEGVFE